MNRRPHRLAAVTLAAALATGLVGCSDGDRDARRSCDRPGRKPNGVQADFPLPAGSYPAGVVTPKNAGYRKARFVVPAELDDVLDFARTDWRTSRFELGVGEHDEHDAEYGFRYPDGSVGAIEAQEHLCTPTWTELFVIIKNDSVAASSKAS